MKTHGAWGGVEREIILKPTPFEIGRVDWISL
jgi:hypothetical protein